MVNGIGSVGSSAGRITFGGLASGIDTNSIINALMGIGQRTVINAQNRRDIVQTKINALNALNTSLSALATSANTLKDPATFSQRTTSVVAQTADANKVTATASNGAALQNFTFEAVSLATATTAYSANAIGTPISSAVPLDEAGFGAAVTAGTFSINGTTFTIDPATPTDIVSAASIGATASATSLLQDANLDIAPTSGSFQINGTSINFDVAVDSLNDVIARVNASSAGVTATYDDGTQSLTLTAKENGPAAITLADAGGGNFLEAMRLIDNGGGTIGTVTAGTDLVSLDDVILMINNAAIGVTASIVNDASAQPNLLELTSGSTVQLGSGSDTSNFLSVTSLLESPPGTTRTSVHGLGQTQQTSNLEDARLTTALSGSSGTFEINGVEINWDATQDSLQNIITRINGSGAGVTATYDSFNDRFKLTSNNTGSTTITVADTSGNLLTALGTIGATQTLGVNASYRIDGGALRYSASNVITDAVPGVTLTMTDTTTTTVKVSVNLATQNLSTAVDTFVQQYNATTAGLRDLVKYDPTDGNGILFGDPNVQRIQSGLRESLTGFISGLPSGLRSLSDVGLTFGAVGAAIGSTNDLVFDAGKFQTAITTDAAAVGALFSAFVAQADLEAGGTGSLESISGTPTSAKIAGHYTITSDALGNIEATFYGNDGAAPLVTSGTISAGGTNTTLIPGLTLTAKAVLVGGSDTITISATQQGFAKTLAEYVSSLSRAGGTISISTDEMQQTILEMNNQIDRLNRRLEVQQSQLVTKFSNMELAISRLQSQGQALTQLQAQLANMSKA